MEMCPRPPITEPATRQETLSPPQRDLGPGVGRGAWFQVHACTWLLTRTVLLHGHHVGSLALPTLPTQAQLQGVNGSHTYLRMSFLLKNVQSCRENTRGQGQSVVWPWLLLPQTLPGRWGAALDGAGGRGVTTTLPAPRSRDGCPLGPGTVS